MPLMRVAVGVAVVVALLFDTTPAAAGSSASLFATYQVAPPASAGAGTTLQLPVTLLNAGTDTWNAVGPNPVNLSYHWLDAFGKAAVWDGARTPLGSDVPGGGARQLTATIPMPSQPGPYQLQLALVKEGIAWLNPSVSYPVQATPAFSATFGAVSLPTLLNGTTYTIAIPVSNSGVATWNATGPNLVDVSYHWTDGAGTVVVWDGTRTPLPADVAPSGSTSIAASITTPKTPGAYTLTVDLVREGVAWFGSLGGLPLKLPAQVSPALYAATYTISATTSVLLGESRTVAVTVTNNGNVAWSATGPNPVNLAYHVFAANGSVVVWDGARTAIGADLLPGQLRSINVA